eukprot:TRINITY_DN2023_c0_g1_i8.p1 TRINITY_DN2023_c0_g1~~TRINITY_DN2023_c0_g1_i8.p1  ORF type:complete len:1104 (+),score=149.51 TRINITY_DN2023_c0_g1_i8:46-3357(+)
MTSLRWPLLLTLLAVGNAAPQLPFEVSKYDHHIEANGAVAYWKIDGDVLNLGLVGEGWWAGFGVNDRPTMQGADIVVCQQSQDDPDRIEAVDYHADGNSKPKMDFAQDWVVMSSGRVASPLTTWCELKRSLTTCDAAQDWQIRDVTLAIRGLLAWSGEAATRSSELLYHGGENRRHQLMSFDGRTSEAAGSVPPPSGGSGGGWSDAADAITEEFDIPTVEVPSKSGSLVYTYAKIELPDANKPYHAIAWRLTVDLNSDSVKAGLNHHMTMHKCPNGIPGATVGAEVTQWDAMANCEGWLGGVNTLPEDEGIPFSGGGKTAFYIAVERHFYNPTNKVGISDSGGKAAIEFTENLRPKVMSQLGILNTQIKVPGQTYGYVHRSHCPAACTQKMGEIRVARVGFHAHGKTQSATLRHIRDGQELEPLLHVEPYDDSMAFKAVDRLVKPGDELIMDCVYDNDLDTEIVWGSAIEQEMCLANLDIIGLTSVKSCIDSPKPNKWPGYDASCAWCVANNDYVNYGCHPCDLSKGRVICDARENDEAVYYDQGAVGDPNSLKLNGDIANDRLILKYAPFQLTGGKTCTAEDGYVEEVTPGTAGSCPAGSTISGSTDIIFKFGGPLQLSWVTDCDKQEVTFTMERRSWTAEVGWMAFGLHDAGSADLTMPMPSTRMNGADIVQIAVEDSSLKDAKGEDYSTPRAKTSPVATLVSAEYKNGLQKAVFKRPFASPDGLTLGQEGFVWFIGAYGVLSSDFSVKHLAATSMDSAPVSLFGGTPGKRLLRQVGLQAPIAAPTTPPPGQASNPTASPTASPTTPPPGQASNPTASPTASPTTPPPGQASNPTASPTASPTTPPPGQASNPTASPTASPTTPPPGQSSNPTAGPTTSPTTPPPGQSSSPTAGPTTSPTTPPPGQSSSPTAGPTTSPTTPPPGQSSSPTAGPTATPTSTPVTVRDETSASADAAKAVSVEMVIANLNYADLTSNETLLEGFKAAIFQALSSSAGGVVTSEHMKMELSPGSVRAKTVITTPGNVDATGLQESLKLAEAKVKTKALDNIQAVPGISDVAKGEVSMQLFFFVGGTASSASRHLPGSWLALASLLCLSALRRSA